MPPSVDKFSVNLGLTPSVDVERMVLLLLLLLLVVFPVRSVLEDNVEKLDGLELEKPFSSSVLISVDGRYWYILGTTPVIVGMLFTDDLE